MSDPSDEPSEEGQDDGPCPVQQPSQVLGCRFSTSQGRDEADEDVGEFYFESDHLALKGNPDYLALLRTLAVLEGQKVAAVQDIDR